MKQSPRDISTAELKVLGLVAFKTDLDLKADYSGVETEKCRKKMEKCLEDTLSQTKGQSLSQTKGQSLSQTKGQSMSQTKGQSLSQTSGDSTVGQSDILDILTNNMGISEWQRLFLLSLDDASSEKIVSLALETGDAASPEEKEKANADFREWCEDTLYLNLKLGTIPRALPQMLFRVHWQILAFTSSFSYQDVKAEMEKAKKFSPTLGMPNFGVPNGWSPSRAFIVANRAFFKAWTALEMQRDPAKGFYMFALERDTLISRKRDLILSRSIYTDSVMASLSDFPRGQERDQLEKWLAPNEKFSEDERKLYVRTRARK